MSSSGRWTWKQVWLAILGTFLMGLTSSIFAVAGTVTPAAANTGATTSSATPYHSLTPARICDTRQTSVSGITDQCTGKTMGPGTTLTVQVAGNGGVPSTGAEAVVMNVTVTDTTAGGYLTVWPAGQPRPLASNLNWTAGQTVPNLVEVGLGSGGEIDFYNSAGSTNLIVDVEGYTSSTSSGTAGLYEPLPPARICDTRQTSVSGITDQCTGKTMGPGTTLTVQVAGNGGVPSTGVEAVVMNVTVAGTTAGGYLTVWPAGQPQPLASNLNWPAGRTVSNRVVVPLGSSGQIDLYNATGAANAIIDVNGWFTSGSNPSAVGAAVTPVSPARICDTRQTSVSGITDQCTGKTMGPGSTLTVQVAGKGGVPSTGVEAVVMNVTVTDTTAGGYLTVWPAGQPRPLASDLNWSPGEVKANLVVATLGASGAVSIYSNSGSTDVIIDVVGYFTSPGTSQPQITTSSLPTDTVGKAYSATLSATGGVAPYVWSITYGALPGGLSLASSSGVISGTPTAGGTAEFTVEVTDANGNIGAAALSISIGPPAPLQITTTSLPPATVGSAYSATLQATGGVAPYSWAVTSGSLPAGLSLDASTGVISGTPTKTGSTSFGVAVTDAEGARAQGTLTITVTLTWSAPLSIDPNGGPLTSVSCPSSSFCMAVDGGGNALSWNGSSWSALVSIDQNAPPNSVSCPSSSFCMAVDWYGNALSWNGSSWSAPVSIDQNGPLTSVSCPSSSFCMAVDNSGYALSWNGSSWSAPVSIDQNSYLASVSCPSSSFCMAVDGYGNALTWNGSSWSAPLSIDPNVLGLNSVSCASSSFCMAVDWGGYALSWNGSSWSAPVSIDPNRAPNSVSCPSSSFCMAVDNYGNALSWNGSSWSAPVSIDQNGGGLNSVSCASSSFCMAVDSHGNALIGRS